MPQSGQAFLNAPLQDKIAYLSARMPEFAKAGHEDQVAYIQHLSQKMQPAGSSDIEKAAPPKNYGFTPGNMLHGLGEGVKGIFTGGYALAKDIANNPNWVMGPDSTYKKFIDAPAAAEANKAGELWNKGGIGNRIEAAGHELAGAVPMVGPWAAHLGERAGTGDVGGAASEAAGAVGTGYMLPKVRGLARDAVYENAGAGPKLTKLANTGARVAGGAAGLSLFPGAKYEAGIGGAMLGPEVLKKIVGKPRPAEPVYRDATVNKRNIPEYAGEGEESPDSQTLTPLGATQSRGRMTPPLRPLIGTPEQWQIHDNLMPILANEAKDSGMYSAARGAVRRIPDYQERIGRTLRQFGPPENLMEESTPPVRRKVENE